jgi:hypothetical protein
MEFNEFLALLAQGLLVVSLPILILAAAYWFKQRGDEIKSRLSRDRLSSLESIGANAVRAAEQAGITKQIVGGGAKKEYALKTAQDYLRSLGIRIDVRTVANVVESEVLRQFNSAAQPGTDVQPSAPTPTTRATLLEKAIEYAVLAAEQSGLKAAAIQAGASMAEQKKTYALGLAGKYLEDNGLRVDMSVVDGLIEAQIMKFKIQAAQAVKK